MDLFTKILKLDMTSVVTKYIFSKFLLYDQKCINNYLKADLLIIFIIHAAQCNKSNGNLSISK